MFINNGFLLQCLRCILYYEIISNGPIVCFNPLWPSDAICVMGLGHPWLGFGLLPIWGQANNLTHWGRVTHICVGKLTIIGSDNGLSPGRRQAIIWTNVVILLIRTLGTNFSEILSEFHTFSFKKMHLKMSSAKWRPFCLGLNVSTNFDLLSIGPLGTNFNEIFKKFKLLHWR